MTRLFLRLLVSVALFALFALLRHALSGGKDGGTTRNARCVCLEQNEAFEGVFGRVDIVGCPGTEPFFLGDTQMDTWIPPEYTRLATGVPSEHMRG